MPTKREREYYAMGFQDGLRSAQQALPGQVPITYTEYNPSARPMVPSRVGPYGIEAKPKRKLSAWQKYIKNKRNHIKYRDGKLNLKKMGVEFRRKKRR